jgi:hypothetical protein
MMSLACIADSFSAGWCCGDGLGKVFLLPDESSVNGGVLGNDRTVAYIYGICADGLPTGDAETNTVIYRNLGKITQIAKFFCYEMG